MNANPVTRNLARVGPGATALIRWSALIALALGLTFVLTSCNTEKIPSKPMPPGATYTGLWYSSYDDMRLVQKGDEVTGTFEYKDGGRIAGHLEGGVLLFEWVQEGDLAKGRRDVVGKGYFIISDDGEAIAGRWGYGDSRTDGGEADIDYENEDPDKR